MAKSHEQTGSSPTEKPQKFTDNNVKLSKKDFAMPRRTRSYLPGYTYHIVQRGNNRQACFFAEEDYLHYLNLLRQAAPMYGVLLHGYCLMTNHVHLLMTPNESESISNTLKVVGSRYAQGMNKRYERTGTLWEGRHKSSAVDTDHYLLKCYRYIELNPVNAGMVQRPEEYRWSSYHANGWGDTDSLITPHTNYLALANNKSDMCFRYRELFKTLLSEEDLHAFRKAAHYSAPIGNDRLVNQIAILSGKTIKQRRGRPVVKI